MDKVIIKDKKKKNKSRMTQPFKMERDYQGNQIRNMDNHDISDYHIYENIPDGRIAKKND